MREAGRSLDTSMTTLTASALFCSSWGPFLIVAGLIVQNLMHWRTGILMYLLGVLLCSFSWGFVGFIQRRLPAFRIDVISAKQLWWFNDHPDWKTKIVMCNVSLALRYRPLRIKTTVDETSHILLAWRGSRKAAEVLGRELAVTPTSIKVCRFWPGLLVEY